MRSSCAQAHQFLHTDAEIFLVELEQPSSQVSIVLERALSYSVESIIDTMRPEARMVH